MGLDLTFWGDQLEAGENDPSAPAAAGQVIVDRVAGAFLRSGAAAIGNAMFDATGVRVRREPFTPERVKAVLRAT